MTWEARDLPVLRAIVEMTDEGAWHIEADDVTKRIGLGAFEVERAFNALAAEHPPFFEFEDITAFDSDGREIVVYNPTGHARRTVGSWPTPELLANRIVSGLNAAAEVEEDYDKRSKLKKTAGWLGGAGRDILVDITTAVITKQTGIS
ncbi:hypothetical protein [Planotetraspora kaengkrachanensis]|uniref:Uncharacterized protein n=1 Tax=Planotetraspora kaengkrachanensis TaxID=575193 RepID=A0A8J3M028_9ACTN|nr:hypothetical protein [Planotetraspora kaengkrachanensis]GIG79603.1 hypothetical protein Pka01_27300 [Planotetraspora kaengkrachanensis]